MGEFRIGIDLSHLIPPHAPFNADAFPHLAYAVKAVTAEAHRRWIEYANGKALPDGRTIPNRTGEYARSIMMRETGPFSGEVYSDLPYAKAIEEGAPARDLKTILSSSLKVRLTKDGRRYLIIPFRHNTPNSVMGNAMPEAVHQWWAGGTPSAIVNGDMKYRRLSGTGAHDIKTRARLTVPAWRYAWGSRLGLDDLAGMGITGKRAKHLEGMVNFRKPGGSGQGAHSQFITFRVMVEGAKGWVSPARTGLWPARAVADGLKDVAERAFTAAVTEDIKALLET